MRASSRMACGFLNGIAVSADHRRLVVAEMDGACLADYDIAAGRRPEPARAARPRQRSPMASALIATERPGSRHLRRTPSCGSVAMVRSAGASPCPAAAHWPARSAAAERRTLFCLSAETSYEELRKGKSVSRIDVVEVDAPGDGYPEPPRRAKGPLQRLLGGSAFSLSSLSSSGCRPGS